MKIKIVGICYNEERMIPLWHDWYKDRFSDIEFTIYDNFSTDKSVSIAKDLSIEIIQFDTNNKFDDRKHREIRNTNFNCGFVIVGDLDEHLNLCEHDIEQEVGNVIRTRAYDMFDSCEGVRNMHMDKSICFDSSVITMNYDYGGHNNLISSKTALKWSKKVYELHHQKYIFGEDYYVERCKMYADRFEEWNKSVGHGFIYFKEEQQLREHYREQRKKAIQLC